ncbi:MAG: low molecular weight phosphotyrosine protein phosphatase [Proteobacteria bacterium]|nr:low molecular weight phosphotyrosine protein phosphatase [Pseudomonadota bacterium]MDA0927428.1 low molecular weight phosphotyrosine protein phosphatase [Pseudomonadota bacterium]
MASSRANPEIRVLMVCLGNICRSPTAHGVMEKFIQDKGLQSHIVVDSAGTGSWHIGESPDSRAAQAAARRGYDLSRLVARQVADTDFGRFHYILAMDRQNLKDLRARCPANHQSRLRLLLDYGDSEHDVVPDPYYSGAQGFELVLDLVEGACAGLLNTIQREHFPGGAGAR